MSQQKRKNFDIEEKSRIISILESGTANKDLARKYGVPHSTISTIWKDREKIKKLFENNALKRKRARTTKHTKIDEALLKWFKYQKANNGKLSGTILQEKANDLARRLGDQDFVCSSSWIQRFRARHSMTGGRMCDALASVDNGDKHPLTPQWHAFCEGYDPEDIFNADETGLFYNMRPDNKLKFIGEQCFWKTLQTKLTIMVAANMTGSIKRNLLVVGKSEKLRPFISKLPVTYESNVKSFMTSGIFERWLRNWDAELKAAGKNILLLVDSCPAHPLVTNLMCIKLVILPQKVLQPMGQGVIRNLKFQYRTLQMLNSIQNRDNNDNSTVSLLDAIMMLSEAWEKVSQKTIAVCFKQAIFNNHLIKSSDVDIASVKSLTMTHTNEQDEVSMAQIAQNLRLTLLQTEEFIEGDNCVDICAASVEDDIVLEVQEQNDEREDDEDYIVPSLNESLNAIKVLRTFIACNEEFQIQGNYNETLVQLQRDLQNSYARIKFLKQE